ncbi:MAG: aspartate dehydrogenase, partial [Jannaschia sp.]
MTIAILGQGAIAGYVLQRIDMGSVSAILTRPDKVAPLARPPRVACVGDLPQGTSLLLDCAGHRGLAEHGAAALRAGIDVLTLSIGALADKALSRALEEAARTGGARLRLASGAIGGLDTLRAARVGGLSEVIYRGRKPAAGWL